MRRRTGCRAIAVALGIVAPAISVAASAPALAATLHVLDAQYGDPATSRLCDATRAIRALCDGLAACSIPVGNALCGDPAYGTPKRLQMAFKCEGSVPELLVAPEPDTVRLACAGAPDPLHET